MYSCLEAGLHSLILDGRWLASRHPTQRRRRQPYLTDNQALSRAFRKQFTEGLRRLVASGDLRLEGEWAKLRDPEVLDRWLGQAIGKEWNVFIEGPPQGKSDPVQVLKYLACYMTGGPIADRRIISDEDGRVTFWARSKNKKWGSQPRPFSLSGKEFVRRWTLHILPKGYTRSRSYGGYHGSQRKAYLAACRASLPASQPRAEEPTPAIDKVPKCVTCETPMDLILHARRPSWKVIFDRGVYADRETYCPLLHIDTAPCAVLAHDRYG